MNERREAALVAAARRGEGEAFTELLERHRPRVRAVAHRLLRDWEEAEDVAQEALLQAHLALAELRDPDRFGAWLRGITINLAKMRLRKVAGHRAFDAGGGSAVPTAVEPSADIELLELVREALERLSRFDREVVYLHHVAELSCAEIGARFGDTPGAVRVRLHRARARLREPLSAARAAREEKRTMVEVELDDVIVRVVEEADKPPQLANPLRIVLLRERGGDRVLPIWVGGPEGDALALHRAAEVLPRPLTPDLMARLVEAAGARVERVAVTRLEEKTFYATITVCGGKDLDARPSDALNLAVRVGAPVFVDGAVLDQAAVGADELTAKLDEETRKHLGEELPGEWRSLTPELVQSFWPGPKV